MERRKRGTVSPKRTPKPFSTSRWTSTETWTSSTNVEGVTGDLTSCTTIDNTTSGIYFIQDEFLENLLTHVQHQQTSFSLRHLLSGTTWVKKIRPKLSLVFVVTSSSPLIRKRCSTTVRMAAPSSGTRTTKAPSSTIASTVRTEAQIWRRPSSGFNT